MEKGVKATKPSHVSRCLVHKRYRFGRFFWGSTHHVKPSPYWETNDPRDERNMWTDWHWNLHIGRSLGKSTRWDACCMQFLRKVVVFKYFSCSPLLPLEMIQFDDHIFQMGWLVKNHQLVRQNPGAFPVDEWCAHLWELVEFNSWCLLLEVVGRWWEMVGILLLTLVWNFLKMTWQNERVYNIDGFLNVFQHLTSIRCLENLTSFSGSWSYLVFLDTTSWGGFRRLTVTQKTGSVGGRSTMNFKKNVNHLVFFRLAG